MPRDLQIIRTCSETISTSPIFFLQCIVSLKIVYGPFWQSTMHLISAPDQPGSKRMYHYPVRAYCSNIYIYRGSKDVVWYFIYSFNKKETTQTSRQLLTKVKLERKIHAFLSCMCLQAASKPVFSVVFVCNLDQSHLSVIQSVLATSCLLPYLIIP